MPRCKCCKDKFEAKTFLQKYCRQKDECLTAEAVFAKEKVATAGKKAWNKEKKVLLNDLKSPADWKKELEREINHIVRIIDYGQKCISCGKGQKIYAGHYHSVGANGSLRFNLHNEHAQCFSCNGMKGANIIGYNLGLAKIYGKRYKEFVESDLVRLYPHIEFTIFELKFLIKRAKEIIKDLPEERIYTPEERYNLRTELNLILGIYLINN